MVDEHDTQSLRMHALGFSRPFHLERRIEFQAGALELSYRLTNIGDQTLSFLYAWHPLFAFDEGDRIALPPEVDVLRLDYSRNDLLGKKDDEVAWPVFQSKNSKDRDLSVLQSPVTGTADMLYTERLRRGLCGLYRSQKQQGLILRFRVDQLPYIGLWICNGGWPSTGQHPQVAVAMEPTVAPYNTLSEAEDGNLAPLLAPTESHSWTIRIEVTRPGLSYATFVAEMLG